MTLILTTYSHGQDILVLERQEFLQILYDRLPDKSPIRTGCTVREVKQSISGVEVKLSDGIVETGDMVLGCDGVHSLVRTAMWDHASKTTAGLITAKEKTCESIIFQVLPIFQNLLSRSKGDLADSSIKPSKRTGNASLAWDLQPQGWASAP